MSTESSTDLKSESADGCPVTKMKGKITCIITTYYTFLRDDLAKKMILPYLPSIVRPHIETLTSKLNSIASSHLQSPITVEDVVLLVFALHAFPSLFLLIRYTDILSISAEIYCTFVYPFIQTVRALEQKRHDLTGHFISFWLLLCFMSIFENFFGLRYYFRYYLATKCFVSYCMVDPKHQWILVWDVVVLHPYILPQLGFTNGGKNRTELMKKDAEEKENVPMKKLEATVKTTVTTSDPPKETPEKNDEAEDNTAETKTEVVATENAVDTEPKKEENTREDSPSSDISEYSFVDLPEVESKQQVELVPVTFKVSDMTAENLTAFKSDENVESPYMIFEIVESEDAGHTHDVQGKKYKTTEGALVEQEGEEAAAETEAKEVTENEPELVAEKDDETKESAMTEGDEPTKEQSESEVPKADDSQEDTVDKTDKEEIVTATELPTTEPEKKSISYSWEDQVMSISTKIRSPTDKATSTTYSPEDATTSFLRVAVYSKCVIGNDAFVGMSHLKISDLVEEQGETYKLSLKNDEAPEDFKSGEVSMSIVSE